MSESRMNGLALLYAHRDMEVNHENILKIFDATGQEEMDHSINFFYIAVTVILVVFKKLINTHSSCSFSCMNIKLPFASVNIFSRYAPVYMYVCMYVGMSSIVYRKTIQKNRMLKSMGGIT